MDTGILFLSACLTRLINKQFFENSSFPFRLSHKYRHRTRVSELKEKTLNCNSILLIFKIFEFSRFQDFQDPENLKILEI